MTGPAWTAQGKPVAWQHRIVGQSIIGGTPFEPVMVKDGVDGTSVEGAANLPYDIPNLAVELHTTKVGVPVLWWRSVGSTHTAYSTEVFIDELAHAAGKDPVEFRPRAADASSAHKAVLELAAEKAGWGTSCRRGRRRGVAVHECSGPMSRRSPRSRCGRTDRSRWTGSSALSIADAPINPDVIRAQMEGGIGFGLGGCSTGS